jgi:hypothetical protein
MNDIGEQAKRYATIAIALAIVAVIVAIIGIAI